jgi:hypothetical protein
LESGLKRLNIVVPYRAREVHLKRFVPAVRAYFSRDKIDRDIPYRVIIVEQDAGLPFNRAALANIGFLLGHGESDYTCFHDVDYLPIWADYSWSDTPVAIVWYGAESRPVAVSAPEKRVRHNLENLFGGVVLVPNKLFAQVNGYSNSYWGWGFEDTDLRSRFGAAGIVFGRRKGTFEPLDHDHAGYQLDGSLNEPARANERLYLERWTRGRASSEDGLSTLKFQVLDRRAIPDGPNVERSQPWEIVKVRLNMKPPG